MSDRSPPGSGLAAVRPPPSPAPEPRQTTPLLVLLGVAGAAFVAEFAVMAGLPRWGNHLSPSGRAIADGVALVALLAPVLYLLVYRPLERRSRHWQEAAQALARSEEGHRLAFRMGLDPMFLTAPDGRVMAANPAACELFGYEEEELRRLGRLAVVREDDPALRRALEERARTGRFQGKLTFRTKAGEAVPVEVSSRIYRDSQGREVAHVVARDLRAQRLAEQALRESESRFRQLFEHLGAGAVLYEPVDDGEDFVIRVANRASEAITRLPRGSLVGGRVRELFPSVEEIGLLAALRRVARTGEAERLPAVDYRDDLRSAWVENFVFRLQTGDVVAVFEDVTERRRDEDALRQGEERYRALARRLDHVEAEERRHLAQELHDQVGQNLSALGINLSILGGLLPGDGDGEARRRLEDCLALVDETGRRIRDVMGELRPPALDDYGLRAALRGYCEQYTERTGLPAKVGGEECSPRLPAPVEVALFRVVQEALLNAVKHAHPTAVTVTLEQGEDRCRVVVADDGAGFDPAAASRAKESWGLGIMRERIEAVGGTLEIDATPGAGTRVIATVPR